MKCRRRITKFDQQMMKERYIDPAIEYMKSLPGDLPFITGMNLIAGTPLPFFETSAFPLTDSKREFNLKYHGNEQPDIEPYLHQSAFTLG